MAYKNSFLIFSLGLLEKIARAIGNRARGPVVVRRRPSPLRRRKPKLLVYLRPSQQLSRAGQRTKALPIRQQKRLAHPLNDVTVVQPAYLHQSPQVPLDEVLGLLRILANEITHSQPSPNDLVSPQRGVPSAPPGVSFLGGLQGGRQALPAVRTVPDPSYHQNPGFGNVGVAGINTFPSSIATASASASGASASSSTFIDPNVAKASGSSNLLTIEGQTPSGDLIIGGPGGTITIGAEVLNGISQTGNGTLIHTEFEEIEPEEGRRRNNRRKGLQVASKAGRRPIFLHGKQTVVPGRGTISLGGGVHIAGQGSSPLVIDSGSTLTLNNNAGSGLKAAASGSASGEINIAAASASGSVSKSKGQGGVSVQSGSRGKVIHLKGKDTIKVGGGKNSKIQIGNKASRIKAPANATFIVGG